MYKGHLILSSLVSVTLLSGFALVSSSVSADDSVVDQINITVPTSCTMSGTGMASHNAEIQNNTYASNIGATTLHAFCNDTGGFAIYAVGFTDNEFGKTVLTNASLGTTFDIVSGTADSGDTSNWAMKLAITQDTNDTTNNPTTLDNSFGSYHVVPSTYTKVAHKNTATDMTDTTGGVKLTTTYAAFISKTQPAGTYSGQVKYTLIHPSGKNPLEYDCEAGKICYAPNGWDVVGVMAEQVYRDNYHSPITDGSTVTLYAGNYSRDGYGFAGWADSYDYETNPSVHFYGPQETIVVPDGTSANGLSLYAIWVQSVGSLQDVSKVAVLCGTGTGSLTTAPTDGTANLSSVSALTDQRDNQTYAIAKLADGKCWIIENLRLEAENTIGAENSALAQGYASSSIYGNFSGLANSESTGFSNIATANSLYYSGTQSGTASIDVGVNNYPALRIPRYNNVNTHRTSYNAGRYSYGNYYNWAAAMANTIFYDGPDAVDADGKTSETVNTSLCPSGWRLPYGRKTGNGATPGGFAFLDVELGGTGENSTPTAGVWSAYPNNFVYAGYYSYGAIMDYGSTGSYWSSTTVKLLSGYIDRAYYLALGSTQVIPGLGTSNKHIGQSIRCVVDS